LYEGWTLINRFPEDTLSESVWRLAARPMVPYLFGMAMGAWACWICVRPMLGRPITPESVLQFGGTMFLMGHFFFQAQRENKKLVVQDAADVVEETVGREAAERVKTAAAVQK
jgi:hypothetical protein